MGDFFSVIGEKLIEVVLPMLATTIASLVVGLLAQLMKKNGLELTKEQEEKLKKVVIQAVKATEEAARRAPMSGAEKRHMASELITSQLPEADPLKVHVAIDAALTDERIWPGPPFGAQ